MATIRQRSSASWREIVESKGSLEEQLEFLALVRAYRDDWTIRKQALTAQWKPNFDHPEYIAARDALQEEAETQLLAVGFYEEVTEEAEEEEYVEAVRQSIVDRPVLVLRIITKVANFYRAQQGKGAQQGKDPLSEAQVRTRLLA